MRRMDSLPRAIKGLKSAFSIYEKDLQALPEDAFAKSLGGKARSVADITHEVCLVNDHIGMTMRGEELFEWPEGWITAPVELQTKEACISVFQASAAKTLATVEAWSDEDLKVKVQTEHGETDREERCRFMALHLWYHSGQLNFVQTLLGDDDWHW